MAESHVASALAKRRAELAGAIEATARLLRELRTSLDHLEVTLLLFDPDAKPHGGLMADQGMDTGSTVLVRAMMRRNDKGLRRRKSKGVEQAELDEAWFPS